MTISDSLQKLKFLIIFKQEKKSLDVLQLDININLCFVFRNDSIVIFL